MSHLILFFVLLFSPMILLSQVKENFGDLMIVPQSGHTDTVWNLSTSSDPNYFLSSSLHDGLAILWTMDGKLVRQLSGLNGQIQNSAMSPDGKFLITASVSELALWDINGNILKKMPSNWGRAISFTHDSKSFIMQAPDTTLQLYDIKGKLIKTISGNLEKIVKLDFSPNDTIFVTGDSEGKLKFWNIDGTLVTNVDAHEKGVNFVKFTPDGKHVISGSYDKTIKLWDTAGKLEKEIYKASLFGGGHYFPDLSFAPDGKSFVTTGMWGHSVVIMDLDGNEIAKIGSLYDPRSLAYSSDGKTILIGEGNGNISMFDSKGKFVRRAIKGVSRLYSLDYDGKSILIDGEKGGRLWDLSTESIETLPAYGIDRAMFTKDNKYVIAAQFNNPAVIVFDKNTKKEIRRFSIGENAQDSLRNLTLTNNNLILTKTYNVPELRLWDLQGKLIKSFKSDSKKQFEGVISSDGKYIASTHEGSLQVKDLNGKEIFSVSGYFSGVISLTFSTNGNYLTVCGGGNSAEVYDMKGKLLYRLTHNARIFKTITSSDEKYFLSGGEDKTVKLWDSNGKNLKTFTGLQNAVNGLAFSKDGNYAIVGTKDGIIRFYSIANGNLVVTIMPTEFGMVSISPDGRFDYGDSRSMQFISYRKGGTNEMVSLDQVFQSYYTPDLFKKIMEGTLPKLNTDISSALKKNLPELKLELASNQSNGKIDVSIEACDKGGGLQNIAIYQNGNLIHADNYTNQLIQNRNCKIGTFALDLSNGQNAFKVSAFNSANIKAESQVKVFTYVSPESQKPELHIFTIGVDEYLSQSSKLKFAVQDARGLKENFNMHGRGVYGKVNFYEIYNSDVTRSSILTKFDEVIHKSKIDDTVVVFFSGHGLSIDGKFYYIPYNVKDLEANSEQEYNQKYPAWENTVKQNSISSEDITNVMTQIKSANKMLIIDSCQSGGNWMANMSESKRLQKIDEQRADMTKKSNTMGIAMISAAQQEDSAFENKKLGHGFLAYSILEAMREEKERGKITAFSVIVQASKRVLEVSKQFKKKQVTFVSLFGVDFDLSE